MRRQIDEQKRRDWERRLARFRASGVTVARFCQRESVAVHAFYYWAKRVSSSSPLKLSRRRTGKADTNCAGGALRGGQSDGDQLMLGEARTLSSRACAPTGENVAMVHFDLHHGARLSVPADCLETIRCVVQCLEQSAAAQGTAFREVLLSH
jgi:hypothetical protein